ncbi:MAG: phospholipid carrier-dependent glycosyltransferase [Planctomycetes bacterium]|nr:phospholipid carrier-dependent glycosyltransferase [Planctomycetota bacterium]
MESTGAQSGGSEPAQAPGARGAGRVWLVAFALLVAAALGLRLASLDALLPQNTESDGAVIVRQVALLHEGSADPWREDNWSYYPHLVARTVEWTTATPAAAAPEGARLDEHLAVATAPNLRVRWVVAWLSLLALPATWWIARRFLERPAAFLACAFVALSQLEVAFAQESRAHAPAAAFAALAVAACLRLRARPEVANYVLAGVACGLALGALQSGAAVFLALGAAHVCRAGDRRPLQHLRLAFALAPAVLCFLVFYPFVFEGAAPAASGDAPAFYVREDGNVQFFGHTVFLALFNGRGFVNVAETLAGFEPVLALVALVGLLLWTARARRWSPELAVVLAYVVPYLVVIGLYERTYERFVLQLVPFLACAAAWTFEFAAGHGGRRAGFRAIFAVAGAVVAVLPSAATALMLVTKRSAPDTSERAAAWIVEHVHAGSQVAIVPFVDVPLARTDAALDEASKLGWRSPWLDYQLRERARLPAERHDLRTLPLGRKKHRDAALADPMGYLRSTGARYVLVPVAGALMTDPALRALRDALEKDARLAVRFATRRTEKKALGLDALPLDVGDTSSWPRRNWTIALASGAATVGDVLELYEL